MLVFQFKTNSIRMFEAESIVWFIARDVSDVLGYSQLGHALRLVDDEDKLLITNKNPLSGLFDFDIPDRGIYVINESGVYSMVLNSRRDDAKKFKKWVTSEVLPSIRKTGKYEANPFSSPEDLMVGQAKLMLQVCESLATIQKKMLKLETSQQQMQDRMDGALPRDGYLTILGFCAKHNLKMTTEDKRLLGVEAAKACKSQKLFVDEVPDKRFGKVNAYPEVVLLDLVEF